ncbi:MAG: transaldolase [Acidobacteria bacterium]|jgi:transaldolase|nr:transaldolase [Acidobacteriota bacterium]
MNKLKRLWDEHQQAVWLDFIERDLLTGGGLATLVAEDGVRGVTSNPSIFQKAIEGGGAYDEAVAGLLANNPEMETIALYETLAIEDIRGAADLLRAVWDSSEQSDGFVSLEVSPHLARDTEGTIAEAKRLWAAVDRPNLMIKVPATPEGIPAIEYLIGGGINVNATLMFSLADYEAVASAYLRGIDTNPHPAGVASVASFFVSRVDTKVDAALEEIGTPEALGLRGQAAIANAKLAYRRFEELFGADSFAAHAARGAQVQRPLWASTSTKNPDYRDVVYVEELIGSETVNTLPVATLEAFRDHGEPRASLKEDVSGAERVLSELEGLGVGLDDITMELQVEGVAAFARSFDQLLEALDRARAGVVAG